jgi:hypothetical protein
MARRKKSVEEKELTTKSFQDLVKLYNMDYKLLIQNMSNKFMIVEKWYSDINPFIKLSRMYEFNEWNLLCLDDTSKRDKLLDTFLQNCLQVEDYETAAIIRDTKNSVYRILKLRLEEKKLLEI